MSVIYFSVPISFDCCFIINFVVAFCFKKKKSVCTLKLIFVTTDLVFQNRTGYVLARLVNNNFIGYLYLVFQNRTGYVLARLVNNNFIGYLYLVFQNRTGHVLARLVNNNFIGYLCLQCCDYVR